MASEKTGLEVLRETTIVDCDTMDEEVAKSFGKFQDCTSNQAIAYGELSKMKYTELLQASAEDAKRLLDLGTVPDVRPIELVIEIAMVRLALKIVPHISGRVHIQTNPYYSYSTEKTVLNALSTTNWIERIFRYLTPGFDTSRICIKIPSTWEGMMACRTLELNGISTLATTLFAPCQAVLAAEVGCTYIAPFVDPDKLLGFCASIQRYYKDKGVTKTKVLPASLTSTEEIFALKGVDHITIAPGLLQQLAKSTSVPSTPSLIDKAMSAVDSAEAFTYPKTSYLNDPAAYRLEFTRDRKGASEEKLVQAINIFCDMQDKLESLVYARVHFWKHDE
ncbi:transaldolase [Paecilomyces variotii No. 5]|uniref:Transaldolase n=1 Tax=Byssochlamys spectabilis (strain No. 5 / NBRC 109023) TaxID=1356009 RepID=V5F816_BYSSN|nr:transaldolase [Paecilomyces variotii No. 5]